MSDILLCLLERDSTYTAVKLQVEVIANSSGEISRVFIFCVIWIGFWTLHKKRYVIRGLFTSLVDFEKSHRIQPSTMLEDHEEARLRQAERVSMETQEITPLIKEELRLSIIKKRHASGQDEIKVEFSEPKRYELTEHEKRKRERRREQNRRAAQRCRQKKKLMQNGDQEVFTNVIQANNELQEEVKKLRQEKKILCACLNEHLQSGCCRQGGVKQEPRPLPVATASVSTPGQEMYQTYQECPTTQARQTVQPALPSFADAFETSTFLIEDGFQFSGLRNEIPSDRTWSCTSDDVIPTETLPEAIFDSLEQPDDVFYDNDSSFVKLTSLDMTFALTQEPMGNNEASNWFQPDSLLSLDPDRGHLNEP